MNYLDLFDLSNIEGLEDMPPWAIALGIGFIAFGVLISLIILIAFILNIQKLLTYVQPANRVGAPSSAWLLLIPIFNIIWMFFLVTNVSQSIHNEYRSRDLSIEPKPTYTIGIITAILMACSLIPLVQFLAGLPSFICFIIYWVKTADYKKKIKAMQFS